MFEHPLQQGGQPECFCPAERARQRGQSPPDLAGAAFGELGPIGAEQHVYAAPVERVRRPPKEAPFFRTVDEAGDGRLVKSEVVGQLAHRDAPVPEDREHPQLGQGEVVLGAPPRYQDFPAPVPARDDELVVDVLAAGLHPRVRSQAGGSHYTSTDELPLVPGIDGVGRDPDGRLRYFILPDTTLGAELPALAEAITAGALDVDARAIPLADVEQALATTGTTQRIVLTP